MSFILNDNLLFKDLNILRQRLYNIYFYFEPPLKQIKLPLKQTKPRLKQIKPP